MKAENNIEILARGVCVKKGKLLLCHTKGAANTYLPGGHVEFDESAERSLCREIEEELGVAARVKRFLGAVEHRFVQRGVKHCEINLVFEMEIPGIDVLKPPPSREDYIEFRWAPMVSLRNSKIEPHVLRHLLPLWVGSEEAARRWAGTF